MPRAEAVGQEQPRGSHMGQALLPQQQSDDDGHASLPSSPSPPPVPSPAGEEPRLCTFRADERACTCVVERQRLSYGIGHMFNDLSAACWFSYLLVYLHSVAQLSNINAGYIYLLGHIVDAACTPVVGILSDRSRARYGRRKVWHAVGSAAAALSFPFILSDPCTTFGWGGCAGNATTTAATGTGGSLEPPAGERWGQGSYLLWYAVSCSIFQFGWASVQTTHLALAREIARSEEEQEEEGEGKKQEGDDEGDGEHGSRSQEMSEPGGAGARSSSSSAAAARRGPTATALYSTRYGFGIISTLIVYGVALLLFGTADAHTISSANAPQFFALALIATAVGLLTTVGFHCGTIEAGGSSSSTVAAGGHGDDDDGLGFWLRQPTVWVHSVLYTASRVVVNLSQTYLSLYLLTTLELPAATIASVPLLVYGAGLLASQLNTRLNETLGARWAYVLGLGTAVSALAVFWVVPSGTTAPSSASSESSSELEGGGTPALVYGGAALLGLGCSVLLPTVQSMVSAMVPQERVASTATVWGMMSFVDKLTNGSVILLCQCQLPPAHETAGSAVERIACLG